MHVGQRVQCPPDRGFPGYPGVIRSFSTEVNYSHQGTPYVWVSVYGDNHTSVWPSNRLGLPLPTPDPRAD